MLEPPGGLEESSRGAGLGGLLDGERGADAVLGDGAELGPGAGAGAGPTLGAGGDVAVEGTTTTDGARDGTRCELAACERRWRSTRDWGACAGRLTAGASPPAADSGAEESPMCWLASRLDDHASAAVQTIPSSAATDHSSP